VSAAAIGEAQRVGCVYRKRVSVFADEIVPGDLMTDQGVFRAVSHVTPSPADWALVVHFEPVAGYCANLSVPLFVRVSVWRVCGDR
jgi:hypothetical protein